MYYGQVGARDWVLAWRPDPSPKAALMTTLNPTTQLSTSWDERIAPKMVRTTEHATVAFLARHSGRTLDAYRHDLCNLFQWGADHGLSVLEARGPLLRLQPRGERGAECRSTLPCSARRHERLNRASIDGASPIRLGDLEVMEVQHRSDIGSQQLVTPVPPKDLRLLYGHRRESPGIRDPRRTLGRDFFGTRAARSISQVRAVDSAMDGVRAENGCRRCWE